MTLDLRSLPRWLGVVTLACGSASMALGIDPSLALRPTIADQSLPRDTLAALAAAVDGPRPIVQRAPREWSRSQVVSRARLAPAANATTPLQVMPSLLARQPVAIEHQPMVIISDAEPIAPALAVRNDVQLTSLVEPLAGRQAEPLGPPRLHSDLPATVTPTASFNSTSLDAPAPRPFMPAVNQPARLLGVTEVAEPQPVATSSVSFAPARSSTSAPSPALRSGNPLRDGVESHGIDNPLRSGNAPR